MSRFKLFSWFLVFLFAITFSASAAFAGESLPHPETYVPTANELKEIMKPVDDPRDRIVTAPLDEVLPPEIHKILSCDAEEAKRQWAEIVGFNATELVGKIAPEIKPGKYTYKDVDQHPGLKELFPPEFVQFLKPGAPPLSGNLAEFEIIPTRQLYWHTRYCEATKRNLGKTKLDKDGYIVPMSWQGGCPFPRPSGEFKAQQVLYNFQKRADCYERCLSIQCTSLSFDKNLEIDRESGFNAHFIRLMGRTVFPPYGFLDERAEKNGEYQAFSVIALSPRSLWGMVVVQTMYEDPNKMDPWMIYVPSLRRIRKMSASDTQDPQGDSAYDDREHFVQKITPKRYPYKYDIIGEREFLNPVGYNSAGSWIDSKEGYASKGLQFMRRPCYILQMTQQDPNYLYSKRILYVDKETFLTCNSANYDQRGRLYRAQATTYVFIPEFGQVAAFGMPCFQWDLLDLHSTLQMQFQLPAGYTREDFTIQELIKRGK